MKKLAVLLLVIALAGAVLLYAAPGVLIEGAKRAGRWAAGLELHRVEAAGHQIPYLSGGTGETLLLLHGFAGDKDNWTLVARHLTPHFRVVAPDLPGFGDAGYDPEASYTVGAQVERVRAFARAIRLERFHLGGSSMGGQIAALYAARHPAEVKTLWLLAPGGVLSARKSDLDEELEAGDNPLLVDTAADLERMLAFAMADPPFVPQPILEHLARDAAARGPRYERIFGQLMEDLMPLEKTVRGLRVPTLVVWGTNDRLLHASGAEILGKVIPRSKVVVMPGIGHVPMVEDPEGTAETYRRFVGTRKKEELEVPGFFDSIERKADSILGEIPRGDSGLAGPVRTLVRTARG